MTEWAAGRSNLDHGVINLCSGCLAEGDEVFRVEVWVDGTDVINMKVYARAVKDLWAEWGEVFRAEV